ncbi:MAG: HTH domain-containing protein [Thermoplasmata archaeon]|nr:HTH domain-containing protein [Thermoplasmata archaeon]
MQIELKKEYSQKDVAKLTQDLAEKYGSLERLEQSIELSKCTKPFAVDDFFVWKALTEGGKLTESTVITYTEVFNILTQRRVELLEYLQTRNPVSIRQIAEELGRDYKNVYDDISALEDAELVVTKKKGRNVYITSAVSSIMISFQKGGF